MKNMDVEITAKHTATVHIRVPESWDPARMQQEFSRPQVMSAALESGNPCWDTDGNYTVTYISKAKIDHADYAFPDEVEQLDLLEAGYEPRPNDG